MNGGGGDVCKASENKEDEREGERKTGRAKDETATSTRNAARRRRNVSLARYI